MVKLTKRISLGSVRFRSKAALTVGSIATASLILSACSSSSAASSSATTSAAPANSIAANYNLKGANITVGSLNFTEELLMGYITVDALKAAGANVTSKLDIAGVDTIRQAELAGNIDMFPSYTGTGWVVYLKQTSSITNSEALFQQLNAMDRAQNKIAWIGPSPFNDTSDVAANSAVAKKYHITTISQLAKLVKTNPSVATFCSTSSFAVRPDGLPGLESAYGFTFPGANLKTEALGLIYSSLGSGSPCNFGETYSTDARLVSNHLVVLKDTKKFFPLYNGAETIRLSVLNRYPAIGKLMQNVLSRLTTPVITELNSQVDINGLPANVVAANWLKQQGLV